MSRRKVDRSVLVDAVTRSVGALVRRGEADYLDMLTELAGWIYNFQCVPPARETGAALIALAPVLPQEHLEDLAHGAVFYEHLRRKGNARADALADDVLRAAGVDVDRRNAEINAGSDRIIQQAAQAAH